MKHINRAFNDFMENPTDFNLNRFYNVCNMYATDKQWSVYRWWFGIMRNFIIE